MNAEAAPGGAPPERGGGAEPYEFVILGAGVSGLCLAWQLLHSPLADRPILLVDGAPDDRGLCTLSFWASGPTPFESIVRSRWRELRLRDDDGGLLRVPLVEYEYRTLFFAELQALVKAALEAAPQHRVIEGRACSVEDHRSHVVVDVNGRRFRARWAFDSRFRLADLAVDVRRWHSLRQHFHGWTVRADRPVFDPDAALFMDFRSRLAEGRAFFYVLPFDRENALVELVTLDPTDADPELDRYLRQDLSVERYQVLQREGGISPMTEQPFPLQKSARIRAIGVAGGRLKPSTGYAFTRILEDGRVVIASLLRHGHPFQRLPARARHRLIDGVLLELWESHPRRIPGAFRALFRGNPGDRVLRFLDERASLVDTLRLFLSLPFWPFLLAAAGWLLRRWRRPP